MKFNIISFLLSCVCLLNAKTEYLIGNFDVRPSTWCFSTSISSDTYDIGGMSNSNKSQYCSVVFNVFDFEKQVLSGVEVSVGNVSLMTDNKGQVRFSNLPVGMVYYSAKHIAYGDRIDSLELSGIDTVDIALLDTEIELFLALGQSNMAGRGAIGEHTKPLENAYLLNDFDTWVPAINPMNLYSNVRKEIPMQRLSPSYSFAQTMAKYLEHPVCMIVNARGGTSVQKFAEGGIYHKQLIDRVAKANIYGDVKAVIWHQGESNSRDGSSYLSDLNGLVTDLRETVGDDFYFVAGQLGPWYDKYKAFNDMLPTISTVISKADYVSNDSLWHRGDKTHFNTASQILLGQRYAQKVLAEVYGIEIGLFKISLQGDVYVKCGDDTLLNSGSFTSLWQDGLQLHIFAEEGHVFDHLSINGVDLVSAEGLSEYLYTPENSDVYLEVSSSPI